MSALFRRYELLLPRRFNDGRTVPDELISDTLFELEIRFGAVSSESQTIRGLWRHEEEVFDDELVRVFVDTEDIPESRAYFVEFKERMKDRYQQLDIWLTTYSIEVL